MNVPPPTNVSLPPLNQPPPSFRGPPPNTMSRPPPGINMLLSGPARCTGGISGTTNRPDLIGHNKYRESYDRRGGQRNNRHGRHGGRLERGRPYRGGRDGRRLQNNNQPTRDGVQTDKEMVDKPKKLFRIPLPQDKWLEGDNNDGENAEKKGKYYERPSNY